MISDSLKRDFIFEKMLSSLRRLICARASFFGEMLLSAFTRQVPSDLNNPLSPSFLSMLFPSCFSIFLCWFNSASFPGTLAAVLICVWSLSKSGRYRLNSRRRRLFFVYSSCLSRNPASNFITPPSIPHKILFLVISGAEIWTPPMVFSPSEIILTSWSILISPRSKDDEEADSGVVRLSATFWSRFLFWAVVDCTARNGVDQGVAGLLQTLVDQ